MFQRAEKRRLLRVSSSASTRVRLFCDARTFSCLCRSPNRAVNQARTPPPLAGNHDPGDSTHEYRNADQCSDGPDGTGGPFGQNQNCHRDRGKAVEQEPSPSFNRSESERRGDRHSSVNQKKCSNEHSKRCYAFESETCQCDADNRLQQPQENVQKKIADCLRVKSKAKPRDANKD